MDKIIEVLHTIRPEADFSASTDFVGEYLLDSFDIMALTAELEAVFGVTINTADIVPENYGSVEAIAAMIRKSGGKL